MVIPQALCHEIGLCVLPFSFPSTHTQLMETQTHRRTHTFTDTHRTDTHIHRHTGTHRTDTHIHRHTQDEHTFTDTQTHILTHTLLHICLCPGFPASWAVLCVGASRVLQDG